MTITVRIAGTDDTAEFPDGTPPEVMKAALARHQTPLAIPERVGGVTEAAMTLGSAALAEPAAGLAGLAAAAIPGGKTGAETVESVRESLTFQPRTRGGQRTVRALGSALAPVGEAVESGLTSLGDLAFDLTGSPAAAAAAISIPVGALELLGLKGLRSLRKGTRLIDDAGRPTPVLIKELDKKGLDFDNLTPEARAAIPTTADKSLITRKALPGESSEKALIEQIRSGGRDDALAGLMVRGDDLVPDRLALEVVRQGFDDGFVQSIKTASPATKGKMLKMLTTMRRIKKNRRLALDMRPTDVVGDSVLARVKFIRNKADSARKELNTIADTRLRGKKIDAGPVVDTLQDSLDDLNVTLVNDAKGIPRPVFEGSQIAKDRTSQRIIKDAIDLMAEDVPADALRMHNLKRQLDALIDFRKKSAGGLTDAGRNVMKSIRRSINDQIRSIDSDYARVNDVLHESLTALDDFSKATGPSIDVFADGANKAVGTNLRALMGNRQKRVQIENSVNQLDSTAANLGGSFSDDIKDLSLFANRIEDVFGAVAETSFKGEIASAVKQVGHRGVAEATRDKVIGSAAEGLENVRGINDFNAFKSMDALLRR